MHYIPAALSFVAAAALSSTALCRAASSCASLRGTDNGVGAAFLVAFLDLPCCVVLLRFFPDLLRAMANQSEIRFWNVHMQDGDCKLTEWPKGLEGLGG